MRPIRVGQALVPGLVLLILALTTAVGQADTHQDIANLLGNITGALTNDPPDVPGFMRGFDRHMPGYDELARDMRELTRDWQVSTSIEFVNESGSDTKQTVDLDWFLDLQRPEPTGPTIHRRQVVHCELTKEGKHWRITSIQPLSLFKP